MGNMEELSLGELISMDMLQEMQDSIVKMLDVTSIVTDEHGKALTRWSAESAYCDMIMNETALGGKLCAQCIKSGIARAYQKGGVVINYCHAGVMECIAPITLNGRILGGIVGVQILTEKMDKEFVRSNAEEFMLDEDKLCAAADTIKMSSQEDIELVSNFISTMAMIVTKIIGGKINTMKASEEIMNAGTAKADFLANMSHEIRTPMNAIIGMAEMALREDLSEEARSYINQIKASGRALLSLINDILDYSKVESGKMELNEVEYEPLSLIHDVSNIIMTRLTDKDVELLLDCDPNIPYKLYGDDLRIRQILINIANNATKFTQKGHVCLKVGFTQTNQESIILKVAVSDTGIGIKEEDMKKLFTSFQQIDSKRNRNVEGTGLGLAICKQLVTLMGGTISVESTYGEGSTFSFEIPQKIRDSKPSIMLSDPEQYEVAGFFDRQDVAEDFKSDASKIGVHASDLTRSEKQHDSILGWSKLHSDKKKFFLIEQEYFEKMDFSSFHASIFQSVQFVILVDAFADIKKWKNISYLKIMKKPLSVLNLASLLNQEAIHFGENINGEPEAMFEAPEAEVLIVDDNPINLTVAEGLLEPLHMRISTVLSGKEALEKLESNHYDIIFMDHMMPELDGVETTRIIRRLHPECNDTPIIALTANAVSGTKEMFLSEGMNDFVAKPIEVRVIMSKVRQWLPPEKLKKIQSQQEETEHTSESSREVPTAIGDLDLEYAMKLLTSQDLFWKVLQDYYRVIEKKADKIEALLKDEDWASYTVEVHALKSASRQIGALDLSELAAELELAGNSRDVNKIKANTDSMLAKYRSYQPILEPYFVVQEEIGDLEPMTDSILADMFEKMRAAVDELDMDEMSNVITEMKKYSYTDEGREYFEKLREAVENIDVDACQEIMEHWSMS